MNFLSPDQFRDFFFYVKPVIRVFGCESVFNNQLAFSCPSLCLSLLRGICIPRLFKIWILFSYKLAFSQPFASFPLLRKTGTIRLFSFGFYLVISLLSSDCWCDFLFYVYWEKIGASTTAWAERPQRRSNGVVSTPKTRSCCAVHARSSWSEGSARHLHFFQSTSYFFLHLRSYSFSV